VVGGDPQDAGKCRYLTIGHDDQNCKQRLNEIWFQIPVISFVAPRYPRGRLVLLLDYSCIQAEAPGF
jgi:hypothetical protein